MKKILKRLCTGLLTLATVFTALPTTAVHASEIQYWTESAERVGIVERVENNGSISETFNEGHMTVEGEDAYCIDINTRFKNGYKTRADASTRMSADQIADVALSIEYVKQYADSHKGLSSQHSYLLRQLVVWQRLSVHLGWNCDNVRASYDEISKSVQDEVFAGATYGLYSDKECKISVGTLTVDANGNSEAIEVRTGTVYIKELTAPAGYQLDKTVYSLSVKAGETATLKVSDTPKVTDTLIDLFKIDMETGKATAQGNASLEGAYMQSDGSEEQIKGVYVAQITEDGNLAVLSGSNQYSVSDKVIRGGVKIGAGTHKRLADVPFKITSKTTGESHIVVTDKNGQFSTSAEWASHKNNTNAGKTSEDGVWFGTSEPDDSKGALLYDTYEIEELRCDSNKGFKLIPAFDMVVSRNKVVIDLGTLTDEYEKEISIHTTATSKDGEKSIVAGKEVTIIDTVTLDGLEKGTKYQLKGWEMIKEENAELIIDRKRVENDYTFTADSENMEAQISFTFEHMELKFVVPNMAQTFGNLEFAGENEVEQRRINGRMSVLSRSFNLYSDVQRADDIIVVLPAEAGEKHFQPEQKVKLVNPRITAEGYKIGNRGFTNYILLADDMLPANN